MSHIESISFSKKYQPQRTSKESNEFLNAQFEREIRALKKLGSFKDWFWLKHGWVGRGKFVKAFILGRERYGCSSDSVKQKWAACYAERETYPLYWRISHYPIQLELMDAAIKARDIMEDLDERADHFISKFLLPTGGWDNQILAEIDGSSDIEGLLTDESAETGEQIRKFIACVLAIFHPTELKRSEIRTPQRLFRSFL